MSGGWKSSLEYPGLQNPTETQFPQELWDGGVGFCHISGFFPPGENIQPSQSVPEHPKTFNIFMRFFFQDGYGEKSGRARCP